MCNKKIIETSSESGYSSEEEIFVGNFCNFCQKKIGGPRTALVAHLGTKHTNIPINVISEKIRMSELHLMLKVRKLAIQRFLNNC